MNCHETNGLKKHIWSGILTIVMFLLAQSFAGVWWASAIATRVEHVEDDLQVCEERVHHLEITKHE